ncbi:hypothetical protein NBRC116188_29750 [Oceaniserpentilla sp. 4NH20-0058]|uniref:hypothetical protein n=1 Tax=Oceaniserpentilla sp. 4NH20-0058 TaxID=3127660 RepID=UPI0031074D3D
MTVLNLSQVCGYDDWALGLKKDVTHCSGELSYNLDEDLLMPVIIEEGRLYLTDGSSNPSNTYFERVE